MPKLEVEKWSIRVLDGQILSTEQKIKDISAFDEKQQNQDKLNELKSYLEVLKAEQKRRAN